MTGYTTSSDTLVIITGGARGFGKSLVEAAISKGLRVASISRSRSAPYTHPRVTTLTADCSHERELEEVWGDVLRLIQAAENLILVNNAGYYVKKPFEASSLADALRTLESNVLASVNVTRRVLAAAEPVCIVNVVSSSGLEFTVPRSDLRFKAMYAGSKRILSALTESLLEHVSPAVRVINLYPRNINTWSPSREADSMLPEELANWVMRSAMSGWPWDLTKCVILPSE